MQIKNRLKQRVRIILEKFFYLKLCYSRTQSYIGIPLELVQKFFIISLWLKTFMSINLPFIIGLFVLLVSISVIIGHIDIKTGLAHEETRINNLINPDLQEIKNNVKR